MTMSDVVNEFFKRHYPTDLTEDDFVYASTLIGPMRIIKNWAKTRKPIFPRMKCMDGFTMSVQGRAGAYSQPHEDFADSYVKVEVGFLSEREELLMPFAEDEDHPIETVYGYVPIAIIEQIIAKHGGLIL
jgi:hypothetical protein